jgi:hypothetical protein
MVCIVVFASCVEKGDTKQEPFSGTEAVSIQEMQSGNDEPVTDPLEGKSVQEIIQDYDGTVVLRVTMEGNFTNSGNREILGFYQRKSTLSMEWGVDNYEIDVTYCFVFNADETEFEHIYPVDYWTSDFTTSNEANTGLSFVLGRDLIWRDRRIGCVGDFNGNGKEELYLFQVGLGMLPVFLEFDQNSAEFADILHGNRDLYTLVIKEIYAEQKIIFLESITQNYSMLPYQYWYIWDENTQGYTVLKKAEYPYMLDAYTITNFSQFPETATEFKEKYKKEILEERITIADSASLEGNKDYVLVDYIFVLNGQQYTYRGKTEEEAKFWKWRIEEGSVQNSNVKIIGMNVSDLKRLINRVMDYQESGTDASKVDIIINNEYTAYYYLVIGTENDTVIRYDLIKKE